MNPAVPWTSYWTPLRFVLLFKLTVLFKDEDLKEAWNIRIESIVDPIFKTVV